MDTPNSQDPRYAFHRALTESFKGHRLLLSLIALLFCFGLILGAFAAARYCSPFVGHGLRLFSAFMALALLMPVGALLCRGYQREKEGKEIAWRALIRESMDTLLGTTYFAVPPLLVCAAFLLFLSCCRVLFSLPGIGKLLSTVLAFVPFLVYLSLLLLAAVVIATLFFVIPEWAQREKNQLKTLKSSYQRLAQNPYTALKLLFIASAPAALVAYTGFHAAQMSLHALPHSKPHEMIHLIHKGLVMLPITVLLAPPLSFFFNFAVESRSAMEQSHDTVRETL